MADIHDLGLARERGSDLVGIGAIVQRPLAAVIARGHVQRARDLEGRRVGVTGLPSDQAVLHAIVRGGGGDPRRVRVRTIGFSAVPSLIARRVDAVVSFWNVEGVILRARGVRTTEFRVDRFGAPRYPELVLVARGETVRTRPALLRRVVAALRDGTRDVATHPDAAVAQIARVSGAERALVDAQLAAIRPALSPPLRLDRAALEAWAHFDARFGVLRKAPRVRDAFALDLTR